jgi:hypothetical protein
MAAILGSHLQDTLVEPLSLTGPVELLRARAAQLAKVMIPRVRLHDGSLGYRAKAQTTITVKAGPNPDDPNAPQETIHMVANESEIHFHDPVLTLDGALRIDLEIWSYIAEGISTILFNNEPVRLIVGRGADPMIRPTFGRFEIPLGTEFGQTPVHSIQHVYLIAETPLGRLHNPEAARMTALITSIPPVGQPYRQDGIVPLANQHGQIVAAKTGTDTELIEVLADL